MKKLLIALIAGMLLLTTFTASAAAESVDRVAPTRLLLINETLSPDSPGAVVPFAPYYEWLYLAYG